jgi:hypothetical protein
MTDYDEQLANARYVRNSLLTAIENTPPDVSVPALLSLALAIARRYPELTADFALICSDMSSDLDDDATLAAMPAF